MIPDSLSSVEGQVEGSGLRANVSASSGRLHVHHLTGCAPEPLAHYLKALGIFRIVAEQKDRSARGWWKDEHFCLMTTLDSEQLEKFLLEEYAPTPFVSPWNKGSGFFHPADRGLKPIEASRAARFEAFRTGIAAARASLAALAAADAAVRALKDRTKPKKGMTAAEKATARALKDDEGFKADLAAAERKFKALKADLFRPYALGWRGPHRDWMDAALVLAEDAKPSFPSLLGTGGNDGRIDFTNNAMQRLADLFDVEGTGAPTAAAPGLLADSLWLRGTNQLVGAAVGQFLPGSAGGANATTGPEGSAAVNPWDFVLMLEGAVAFSARATRRLDPAASSRASAPFAVRAHVVGHGSGGNEKSDRGEQWMPLWSRPSSWSDVRAMLGEARLQLGRTTVHRPIDVARAVARLGTARGISRFVRYGYLERYGQSTLAVPLGRIEVQARPRTRLIDDLASWMDDLQRLSRDAHAPARLVHAERRLADAVFALLTHDDSPARWQSVLLAAVGIEAIQASGTAFQARPIPPLSVEWLSAADDGTPEWRLACALGSAAASYGRDGPRDPIRGHWLPLDYSGRRFLVTEKRLGSSPRVVISGRDPITDLSSLVERRLLESTSRGQRLAPLVAAPGLEALPSDLAALVAGEVDLERVLSLGRALMAVRWDRWSSPRRENSQQARMPDDAWVALRLASLPWPVEENLFIPTDDALLRRLASGDGSGAVSLALRRLRSSGLRPPLEGAAVDERTARLWAAALAFPISVSTARLFLKSFVPTDHQGN